MTRLLIAVLVAFGFGFVSIGSVSAQDIDCNQIATPEDAQRILDADPSDPFGLDGPIGPTTSGVPGVPCEGGVGGGDVTFESVFGGGETAPPAEAPATTGTGTADSTTLPDTGVGSMVATSSMGLVTLLAALGLASLAVATRRTVRH